MMSVKIYNSRENNPLHILKGNDPLNIVITIFLLLVIALSVFLFSIIGLPALALTVSAIIGIVSIRYARIYIYARNFAIVRKSIIPKFSDKVTFSFENIVSLEYKKGWTNWPKLLLLAVMPEGSMNIRNRVSKADELIIVTNDGKAHYINRFGNKNNFSETIEMIRRRISFENNSA